MTLSNPHTLPRQAGYDGWYRRTSRVRPAARQRVGIYEPEEWARVPAVEEASRRAAGLREVMSKTGTAAQVRPDPRKGAGRGRRKGGQAAAAAAAAARVQVAALEDWVELRHGLQPVERGAQPSSVQLCPRRGAIIQHSTASRIQACNDTLHLHNNACAPVLHKAQPCPARECEGTLLV